MASSASKHRILVAALSAALLGRPAHALVTLNDGTDRIFVTGTANVASDSNIFSSRDGGSDFVYSGSLGLEYLRKAGWIAVNIGAGVDISRFDKFRSEDFQNPRFSAELNKQTGRTTGALNLGASRQTRTDASLNSRNTSWNYNAGLNVKYPVIERYSLAAGLGYDYVKYIGNPAFVDLRSYSANLNLFYILSNERDLFAGYRYRYNETSKSTRDVDHNVNIGVSGRILARVNGSVSVGYQVRKPNDDRRSRYYESWTAAGTATYSFNKKTTLTGQISKDFTATAFDTSIDSLNAGLELQYARNAKLTFSANVGYGFNDFLGPGSIIAGTDIGREDTRFDWGARISYTVSQHLSVYVAYNYTKNWSNLAFADFQRRAWSAGLSSRW